MHRLHWWSISACQGARYTIWVVCAPRSWTLQIACIVYQAPSPGITFFSELTNAAAVLISVSGEFLFDANNVVAVVVDVRLDAGWVEAPSDSCRQVWTLLDLWLRTEFVYKRRSNNIHIRIHIHLKKFDTKKKKKGVQPLWYRYPRLLILLKYRYW